LMAVCTILVCFVMPMQPDKALMTLLLSLYMLSHVISELYQSRMFQMNRLDLAGQSQFFRTLLPLVCFGVVLFATHSLVIATISLAMAGFISIWLFSYLPCRPFAGLSRATTTTVTDIKNLAFACFPLFCSLLLMNLVIQLPKYVINELGNNQMQGIFNMVFMPAQVINMVAGFIYRPLIHQISNMLDHHDLKGLLHLLRSQMLLVAGITTVGILTAWFVGAPILGMFYGTDLQSQRLAITLVVVGGGIFAFDQLLYYIAVIMRRQGMIFMNYAVTLALSLLVSIPLVGVYGIVGGVCTFIAAHVMLFIGYSALIYRNLKEKIHV